MIPLVLVLVLLAIMVVDIAALISSGNPIQNTSTRSIGNKMMLAPSQVPRFQKQKHKSLPSSSPSPSSPTVADSVVHTAGGSLVPSQVGGGARSKFRLAASANANSVNTRSVTDNEVEPKKNRGQKQHGTRNNYNKNTNNSNRNGTSAGPRFGGGSRDSSAGIGPANGTTKNKQVRKLSSGNLPDVLWRHIPLEHVRKHPHFVPLPEPETIHRLDCIEDVRNFRQESWQWDVLHEGRMTTSQAVAALGFLEPSAGEILGVPKGLRRGGEGAYHRLRKPIALRTLEEMNERLCVGIDGAGKDVVSDESERGDGTHGNNDNNSDNDNDNDDDHNTKYWTQPANFPFAAKYMVQITEQELETRRTLAKRIAETRWSIRMVWGNLQEATSLMTALNYFWKRDKGVLMKEIGMCGAGLEFNQTATSTGLLLGATPDAILCHPDGRIEAVEVKNHCPFVPNSGGHNNRNNNRGKQSNKNKQRGKKNNNTDGFRLSQRGLSKSNTGSLMCQYIPQLMMEMLCIGENCESAIMVRQTATHGSLILRIKRDDDWIEEMMYWLGRFHRDFVQRDIPPPRNFFLEGGGDDPTDRDRYRKFLERTKQIESQVELLEHVPNRGVQRATARHPVSNDLFLD